MRKTPHTQSLPARLASAGRSFGLAFLVLFMGMGLSVLPAVAQSDEARFTQAEQALEQIWDQMPLTLDAALLVEGPGIGFGAYVPRRDQVYASGETIFIYAEPRSFGYGRNGRLYTINLLFDLELYDETGELLFQQDEFGSFAFQSYSRNREIMFNADVTADLPPGAYTLALRVRDRHKEGFDTVDLPFTIAAQ